MSHITWNGELSRCAQSIIIKVKGDFTLRLRFTCYLLINREKLGMYSEHCGLQSILMSWGHDGTAVVRYFQLVHSKLDFIFSLGTFYPIFKVSGHFSLDIYLWIFPLYRTVLRGNLPQKYDHTMPRFMGMYVHVHVRMCVCVYVCMYVCMYP